MHNVGLLERAIAVSEQLGYTVRQEYLGGNGGGACEFGGRKWMFVDLALSIPEQLEQVLDGLRNDPGLSAVSLPSSLRGLLGARRAA